jgi:molecular chaperone DnaK (HSP70)
MLREAFGVEDQAGEMQGLASATQPLPHLMGWTITTLMDGQSSLHIHFIQGDEWGPGGRAANAKSVARCRLEGIPVERAGARVVDVVIKIGSDGGLAIAAADRLIGRLLEVVAET